MSSPAPFFSWKRHLIAVMRERGLAQGEELPRLTTVELERMESFFYWGLTPEEFLDTLSLPVRT